MTGGSESRGIHLVGSIPLSTSEEVFRKVAGAIGDQVQRIPDGETGSYRMPDAFVTYRVIGGLHGAIPIRVFAPPTRSDPSAGLVWLHGGAFARKDLDTPKANYAARELSRRGDVAVVDGRLPRGRGRRQRSGATRRRHGRRQPGRRAADDKLRIDSANELTLSSLADAFNWSREVA